VRTIGALRSLLGSGELHVTLDSGSMVTDLLEAVGTTRGPEVARHFAALDSPVVPPALRVMVNGRDIGVLQGPETVLHENDDVLILTPVAGG
jgi:molybdopterin converting factor small subunit